MQEEVDNDLGQFVLRVSKPAFECTGNSLIVVGAVGNTCSTVPVNGVACF